MTWKAFQFYVVPICYLLVLLSGAESAVAEGSCNSPEYHQFDFWIGDWDVFDTSTHERSAHVRVEPILDGCALREQYEDLNGMRGESLSSYGPGTRKWQQTWLTNRGQLLIIHGARQGEQMKFTGAFQGGSGNDPLVRASWIPTQGEVRETASRSIDGGKNWTPWFDLTFRPRKERNAAVVDDREAVAALDSQYQEAVRKNDVVTMDRILGEHFILVSGTGKTFTKADLLTAARSKRAVYEHQEDSDRTVRLWGDTAIVTAKLWEKGTEDGRPFDQTLWFSDTYVRTAQGWRYVFGQASRPLPPASN